MGGLIAIGEALIDFIPKETGCEFYEVTAFEPKIGGAPANVCGAFARLGGKAKMITQLGNDPFGHKIARELKEFGVDTSCVSFTDAANTALAFVSLAKDGGRTFSFYRKPSADMLLETAQVREEWFLDAEFLHFCSVSLGDFPMRRAHERAVELARKNGALVSFDPNLRFNLWEDTDALYSVVWEFMPKCDIVKISDEELEFICKTKDIEEGVKKLFCGNVQLVLYTCGKDGAYAFTKKASAYSSCESTDAVDTTGAGDGFAGSFLWKMSQCGINAENLADMGVDALHECLEFSNKFCSVSVTRRGAISSYPNLAEVAV